MTTCPHYIEVYVLGAPVEVPCDLGIHPGDGHLGGEGIAWRSPSVADVVDELLDEVCS